MLTPAAEAYGWPVVVIVLAVLGLSIAFAVYDFVKFSREWDRRQAMKRHPAARRPVYQPRHLRP